MTVKMILGDVLTVSFHRGGHYRGGERLTVFGSGFGDAPYSPEVEQPTLNQSSTKVQISTLNAPNNAPPRSNSQPQTNPQPKSNPKCSQQYFPEVERPTLNQP